MRKIVLALPFLLALSGTAAAEDGWYAGIGTGLSFWEDTSNHDEVESDSRSVPYVSLFVGRSVGSFRFEGELFTVEEPLHGLNFGGHRFSLDGHFLPVVAGFANVWYDHDLNGTVSIYAGGGVGAALIYGLGDLDLTPGVQVGTGIGIALSDTATVDLGVRYRWFWPTDVDHHTVAYDTFTPVLSLRVALP